MRMTWAAVAVCLATVVAAGDDKPKPADKPPDKLAAIKKEAEKAEQEMYKKLEALGEDKEAQKKADELYKAFGKEQMKRFEEALEVAKADPKADAAAEAINWMLPRVMSDPLGEKALAFATEHLADSPKIGQAVLTIGRYGLPEQAPNFKAADAFLKAVKEKNKDKTVLGLYAMGQAWAAKSKYDAASYRQQKDTEELATAAEKAFEAAVKEYGDVKLSSRGEGQTVATAAKLELFELQNLRVGKTAPDIEGEDLDGTKFKLSDYKGKVVVIDFWGDW